jgi:hypothetical protein
MTFAKLMFPKTLPKGWLWFVPGVITRTFAEVVADRPETVAHTMCIWLVVSLGARRAGEELLCLRSSWRSWMWERIAMALRPKSFATLLGTCRAVGLISLHLCKSCEKCKKPTGAGGI